MQTNPAAEQKKNVKGHRIRGVSPVGEDKVYRGKDLLKSQVLRSEWKTERAREDASGDIEDGEDDELPCMIGGEDEGDCIYATKPTSKYTTNSVMHSQKTLLTHLLT